MCACISAMVTSKCFKLLHACTHMKDLLFPEQLIIAKSVKESKMKRLLYTSADVRQAIIRLFRSSKGHRVAISAFVGDGAEAYLPKPKGLQLICWPKAGGTNPNVLRKLMKRGVEVFFADRLHMKTYWSEDRGAVVTSANLSPPF